ncbi:MAG: hypothetical protein ACN4A7_05985 [Thermacetogeniaceae bacterium]|jgi:hypothetical protein|nr:hypothetical protein [Thermoanaerobacterales bacterium]
MAEKRKHRIGGESFLVRIQFQDNATWQGTIHWLNEQKTQTFRSLLELITLIKEAVEINCPNDIDLHHWGQCRHSTTVCSYSKEGN